MIVTTLFHYLPKIQDLLNPGGEKEDEEQEVSTQVTELTQVNQINC